MRTILQCVAICFSLVLAGCATQQAGKKDGKIQYVETDTGRWLIHDMNRPAPAVITPGTDSTSSSAGKAPSDTIVLFDGTDLSGWTSRDGSPAKWTIRDGYMESVKGSGPVKIEGEFGSCQLHVEFATPSTVEGSGQGRGNSGVFLMANYEVQILDSYDNITYPDVVFFAAGELVESHKRDVNIRDWDVSLHIVFKSKDYHDKYQKAPDHYKFIDENKDNWKSVRVFDSFIK